MRIDPILIGRYGIFSPAQEGEGIIVPHRLSDLTIADRQDLMEFASWLYGIGEVPTTRSRRQGNSRGKQRHSR